MNAFLQNNAGRIATEIRKRAEMLPAASSGALAKAAESLWVKSKLLLTQLIYQQEIPRVTRKRGKNAGKTVLAWRRKMRAGGLLGSETFSVKADGSEATIGTEPNSPAAKYAALRHALNRPSPVDGKTRFAPWRLRAKEQGADDAMKRFRAVLKAGLSQ